MKVSFPNLRPAAQPANRRQDAARRHDTGHVDAARPVAAPPARTTAGVADQDQWLHDPAAPAGEGAAPLASPPEPVREAAVTRAEAALPAGAPAAPPPGDGDPAAGQARAAAESIRQEVLTRPQAAGVHGNLVPATVLNLLG